MGARKRRCASTTSPQRRPGGQQAPRAAPAAHRRRQAKAPRCPTRAARSIGGSGFGVQLGAFSSAERANEEWKKLQAESAGTLDGLVAARRRRRSRRAKTIYRLQAEVRDEAQARAICGGLKVANKPCVPVIPPPLAARR